MDTPNINPQSQQVLATPAPVTGALSSPKNIMLLVAALLVTIGFFLPWISTGGGGSRDADFEDYYNFVPTINGTFLISNVSRLPEIGWLFTIFLLLVPIGGLIVAYNSTQRSFPEKAMMFGLAATVFIPLSLLTLYLVMPKRALMDDLDFGARAKLGIGFILMAAGAIYCLVYAIGRIIQNAKNVSAGPILLYGALGGVITATIVYLVMESMNNPGTSMVYLYLLMVIGGQLLTIFLYGNSREKVPTFHGGLVVGFIFSAVYVFALLIIATVSNSRATARIGEIMVFLLVFQALFGFIFSSLMGRTNDGETVEHQFVPISRDPVQPVE